jgi:8-oxo-dGTP diphosphatase
MDENRPKVGIGLLVFKEGKLLLAKRASDGLAGGLYAGPGGHIEFGETPEEAAVRETSEETGIEIQNVRTVGVMTLLCWPGKHYIGIELAADWVSGEPQNLEPDKHGPWAWYDLNALPEPLIQGDHECLEAMKTGNMYYGTIR